MKKTLTILLLVYGVCYSAQTKTAPKKQKAKEEINQYINEPDRKAEYVGGNDAMEKYIIDNLKYPEILDKDTSIVSRKLFLKFMVDKNGKVKNVEVVKPIKGCKECTDEALRVMNHMPDWKPAIENKQAVDSWFNLPITFRKK